MSSGRLFDKWGYDRKDYMMDRKVFISDRDISLTEYCPSIDDISYFSCWQDADTQKGYNYQMTDSFEAFCKRPIRSRLLAVIIRNEDNAPLGIVSLSPEGSPPDLAIMLYKPYRGKGYGTKAFALASAYCFESFDFEHLYAECYETNLISRKMLIACGFVPYPDGDSHETHYLTGEPITQYDFVLHRKDRNSHHQEERRSIELRAITEDNFQQCLNLNAGIQDRSFVDPVSYSLAEAWVYYQDTRPFAIYKDDVMIGFVSMYVGEQNYQIINFLIDSTFQRKGFGTEAARLCIEYLRNEYSASKISAPVKLEHTAARKFWSRLGFCCSNTVEDGYMFMRYCEKDR